MTSIVFAGQRQLRSATALCMFIAPAIGQAESPAVPVSAAASAPRRLSIPKIALSVVEPDGASPGAGPNPFTGKAVSPNVPGQTLTAPVTVNANTSADALSVTQSGAGRAISGAVTSSSNSLSAVKGITAGSGSGVNGVNSGTTGQAGKFQITSSSNAQPAILSTTAGSGNALQAVITNATTVDTPAILGQNDTVYLTGVGVQGNGNYMGVRGESDTGTGVYGHSSGMSYGVQGDAENGVGVSGGSVGGNAVQGRSTKGNGVAGYTSAASGDTGYGVFGQSDSTSGVLGTSAKGIGIDGRSTSGFGVTAHSDNYIALYAYTGSSGSYAGYFTGKVLTTSTMTAQSYATTSDRNAKQAFEAIDSASVLDKISALPITEWDYKDKPGIRHIGPMAQDFHAAFGLGADDTHIDLVDGVGVSLAAIKELQRQVAEVQRQLQLKDAQVVAQAGRIDALESQLVARMSAIEQGTSAVAARLPLTSP